jgi:hypothetical protein
VSLNKEGGNLFISAFISSVFLLNEKDKIPKLMNHKQDLFMKHKRLHIWQNLKVADIVKLQGQGHAVKN